MHRLPDVDIRPRYVSGVDDIVHDFVVPCLKASCGYSRASGYFSSSVLSLSWIGLKHLYENGGSIRVICSPSLAYADVEALKTAVEAGDDEYVEAALLADFRQMLASEALRDAARALAALVSVGFLEIRIAVPQGRPHNSPARRIFHQKTGIFVDQEGNSVAFSGSMNETWSGMASHGNIESFQAFASWHGDREATRVYLEARDFEDLWSDSFPGATVRPISDALEQELITVSDDVELVGAMERLADSEKSAVASDRQPYELRDHQADVLDSWQDAGHRGIVKHATGSGKTITALHAIRVSREATSSVVVVVPGQLLLQQWEAELARVGPSDVRILLCGGGHARWKDAGVLEAWTGESSKFRVVIAILATAVKPEFLGRISQGEHLMLVADEVHRLGASQARSLLTLEVGRALGLSATPERAGDSEGTQRIFDFFGPVLEPEYGISDAIREGVLTPYYYSPSIVELTDEEQEKWDDYSAKIARLYARDDGAPAVERSLRWWLMQRARIAKQAENKAITAVDLLEREYEIGQRWLLYCDTAEQMNTINDMLRSRGIDSHVYFSNMTGDKSSTLRYFESVGGVVVSIRCLDEGVDIPAASHALIIASSRNPREFIQRRGRVLRRSPGKYLAHIFDLLVAPAQGATASARASSGPLVGDLARAVEFAGNAINPQVQGRLHAMALQYGVTSDELRHAGFEIDEGVDEENGDDL